MSRQLFVAVFATLVMVGTAAAQDIGAGAGRFEIGAFPGGGMFFTESSKGNEPDFGNYALGASFTVNINRFIGVEADGGATIGIQQAFKGGTKAYADQRTPSTWVYNGNVVINPGGSNRTVVPYLTAGVGGLTL